MRGSMIELRKSLQCLLGALYTTLKRLLLTLSRASIITLTDASCSPLRTWQRPETASNGYLQEAQTILSTSTPTQAANLVCPFPPSLRSSSPKESRSSTIPPRSKQSPHASVDPNKCRIQPYLINAKADIESPARNVWRATKFFTAPSPLGIAWDDVRIR